MLQGLLSVFRSMNTELWNFLRVGMVGHLGTNWAGSLEGLRRYLTSPPLFSQGLCLVEEVWERPLGEGHPVWDSAVFQHFSSLASLDLSCGQAQGDEGPCSPCTRTLCSLLVLYIVVHYSQRPSSDPAPHLAFKVPCKSPGTLTPCRPH